MSNQLPEPSAASKVVLIMEVDLDENMFSATTSGFLEMTDVSKYERQVADALSSLRRHHGSANKPNMLVDVRGGVPQSQVVVQRLQQIELEIAKAVSHVAVIVDNALLRLQARRIGDAEKTKLFDSVEEAREWLATKSHSQRRVAHQSC